MHMNASSQGGYTGADLCVKDGMAYSCFSFSPGNLWIGRSSEIGIIPFEQNSGYPQVDGVEIETRYDRDGMVFKCGPYNVLIFSWQESA